MSVIARCRSMKKRSTFAHSPKTATGCLYRHVWASDMPISDLLISWGAPWTHTKQDNRCLSGLTNCVQMHLGITPLFCVVPTCMKVHTKRLHKLGLQLCGGPPGLANSTNLCARTISCSAVVRRSKRNTPNTCTVMASDKVRLGQNM